VKVFNLLEGELDVVRDEPAGYRWRRARVGDALGAARIGMSVYELDPGEKTFPYHYELSREEWLLVLTGRPTLRTPDGERELGPGDVACFPRGPAGAHLVANRGAEPARLAILSTMPSPAVTVYPDSGKIAVWGVEEAGVFRQADAVGYWEGE
jgi:uncharacterized cupin superfamily protein